MTPPCQKCGYAGTLMYWTYGRYVCFGCRRLLILMSTEGKT